MFEINLLEVLYNMSGTEYESQYQSVNDAEKRKRTQSTPAPYNSDPVSDVVNKVCGFIQKNFLLVVILVVAFFWLFVKDGKITLFEKAEAPASTPGLLERGFMTEQEGGLRELPQLLRAVDTFDPFA